MLIHSRLSVWRGAKSGFSITSIDVFRHVFIASVIRAQASLCSFSKFFLAAICFDLFSEATALFLASQ